MKTLKKITAFIVVLSIICTCIFMPSLSYGYDGAMKKYIVLTDVEPLLSSDRPVSYRAGRNAENEYREALIDYQNGIIDEILDSRFGLMDTENNEAENSCYHFTDVLSGFCIEMTEEEAKRAEKLQGVRLVIEDMIVAELEEDIPHTQENVSDSASSAPSYSNLNAGNLIGVPEAREMGYNGDGRVVAVIDSAIQPAHPYLTLSENSSPYYSKDSIDSLINSGILNVKNPSGVYRTPKIPFAYDYCYNKPSFTWQNDHGLHVSGIVAGNSVNYLGAEAPGRIEGVLPEAQIIFMGVFSSAGGAALSTIIAALDDASKFKVDAVNLSIGVSARSETYMEIVGNILLEVSANMISNGIAIVHSAGNDGHGNVYSTSVADYNMADNGFFPLSLSIGSVQSEYANVFFLEDENGNEYHCEMIGQGSAFSSVDVSVLPQCTAEALMAASGKVAVIDIPEKAASTLNMDSVIKSAEDFGVKAIVFINDINQFAEGSKKSNIPVLYMPKEEGENLKHTANKLSFPLQRKVQKINSAPYASFFSSFGISDNLDISVDFSAPGGHILSSVGLSASNMTWANKSGTSMSTPFATGAVSVLYERIEKDFPSAIKGEKYLLAQQLLSSTANNVYEENGALASVRQMGSGLIDLTKALRTNVVLTSDTESQRPSITLGDKLGESFDVTFKIKNLSSDAVSFSDLTAELATEGYKYYQQRNGYCYNGMQELDSQVSATDEIIVEGNSEKVVTITITPDPETLSELDSVMTNGYFIDGKITLSGSSDNCDISIPFTGFRKSWLSQRIVTTASILNSTYLFSMADDGRYSYCFPVQKNGRMVFYMSENPDPTFFSTVSYFVTKFQRNAYMTLKSSLGNLSDTVFAPKGQDYALPLYSFEDVVASSQGLSLSMKLPYGGGSYVQTANFAFEKDNEAPSFSVEYEDGIAKVTASDNLMITTVSAVGKDVLGKEKAICQEINSTETVTELDISSLSDVSFYVSDNAFNTSSLKEGIYFETENGKTYLKNITKNSSEGTVFAASYAYVNGQKTLEKVKMLDDNLSLSPFDVTEIDASGFTDKNTCFYFWDVKNGLIPLSK